MQWTPEQIIAEIRGFVVASFRDGRGQGIDLNTPLVTSGIVDSAGVLHVVEFLETRFHVQIADEEVGMANFNSIGAMATLVARKRGAAAVSPPTERRQGDDRALA